MPGHILIAQDGDVTSLFLIVRGVLAVRRDQEGISRQLGVLGPGDFVGELALLTGARNSVTIEALTAFSAFEISKAMLEPLLKDDDRLLQELERAASEAQAILDRRTVVQSTKAENDVSLLSRMREFFATGAEPS